MADVENGKTGALGGRKTAVVRFAEAIGYPDKIPDGSLFGIIRVDGVEIDVEETDGRIVLAYTLTDDESLLPMLAQYAAGRMLREDATLAFGLVPLVGESGRQAREHSSQQPSVILWQDAPSGAGAGELRRLFESFMDSCDWWRERIEGRMPETEGTTESETMVIRP